MPRSQRSEARQKQNEGKQNAVSDATRCLKREPKKKITYHAGPPKGSKSWVWPYFKKVLTVNGLPVREQSFCVYRVW